jgi:hypothetical protein
MCMFKAMRVKSRESVPPFDREALKDLARCFARAAVDQLLAAGSPTQTDRKTTQR